MLGKDEAATDAAAAAGAPPLTIDVVTSLYPSPQRPNQGIFAEQRWRGIQQRGHRVRIILPLPHTPPFARGAWGLLAAMPRNELRAGIPIWRPRYWHMRGGDAGNARRFARVAATGIDAPDIVVCDFAWPAAAIAPVLSQRGIPCVVNGRGSDVLDTAGDASLAAELAAYLRTAGHWSAVSRHLLRTMDALGGAPGHGVLTPNGVDTVRFLPRERTSCRSRLGLPDGPLILVVGHLIDRKDPALALRVFHSGAPSNSTLLFVGHGPLERRLRTMAADLGARVRFAGERSHDELPDYYGAADLLLHTSEREGRPNVVLEALASGRPVLATDGGGTAEIVDDPRMLACSRDPAVIGRMLRDLLQHPPSPDALVAKVSGYTWPAALDALESLLRRVARRAT